MPMDTVMNLMDEFKLAAGQPAESGKALPFRCYSDPAFYEEEVRHIFHRDWVFVCSSSAVKTAGDRFALTIAGTQIVVIRGKDGRLRALSNNCTHRGTPLADPGFSHAPSLVCPYHAWCFNLDGSLKAVPHPGEVEINKSAHHLPEFALEEWCGLVFVNIEGTAESLAKRYAPILPYMNLYQCENPQFGMEAETAIWASNWKLVMENAMESYHLFKVHRSTLETVAPTKDAFYVEGHEEWSLTAGGYGGVMNSTRRLLGTQKKGPDHHYLLICLPPSFVGIMGAGGSLEYLSMLPDGPGRAYVRGGAVSMKKIKSDKATEEFGAAFLEEDKWICERAYTGMHTKHATGGQLVTLERIVQNFHRYLGNRLYGLALSAVYRNPEMARLTAPLSHEDRHPIL